MSGPIQQFVDIVSPDRPTQELNNNVSRVFRSIQDNPLLSTLNISSDIIFSSGVDTLINHRLAKKVTGFIIINSNASANIYQSLTINPSPTAQILLKSDADVTASILFF